jgi:gamma-aminobutyric acid type B receptor
VAFSSQGDRIALTQIEQMINGTYFKLGYYDTQADNLTWFNMEQWSGGKVIVEMFKLRNDDWIICFFLLFYFQVPQDRTIVRRVLRTVSLPLFVCMSTISCCGIVVALALIVFNVWHRNRR